MGFKIMEANRKIIRKRKVNRNNYTIWAESNKKGGYIIYAGIKGTESVTIAGGANSYSTLDYNIRKAKHKFGLL
tara:strand:+ start:185 stop:406 length:222 start_codon:yes stop_codon:yes gene_type:complete